MALTPIVMRATAMNGEIEPFEDRVRIKRDVAGHGGWWSRTQKDFALDHITSVQLGVVGVRTNVFIQFIAAGGVAAEDVLEAARDENCITFTIARQQAFVWIKSTLKHMLTARTARSATVSPIAELEKLVAPRDRGIVTEDEFQTKKRQLLGL